MSDKKSTGRAKAPVKKCTMCKNIIRTRLFLKCSDCDLMYCVVCTNVTEKRFYLMTSENKQKWRCNTCSKKIPMLKKKENFAKSSPNTFLQNDHLMDKSFSSDILLNSAISEEIINSTMRDDSLQRSLPNLSIMENSQVSELKAKIDSLTYDLDSAHGEIDKLNGENANLKKSLDALQKKITIYNKLLSETSSPKKLTPNKKNKQKKTKEKLKTLSHSSEEEVIENNVELETENQMENNCTSKEKIFEDNVELGNKDIRANNEGNRDRPEINLNCKK